MAVSLSKKINKLVARKQQRGDIDIENEDALNHSDNNNNDSDELLSDEEDEALKKAHYVDVGESELRKGQAKEQLELDAKYTGAIGSRKELFDTTSSTIPQDDIASESEVEEEEEGEQSDALSFKTDSEDDDEVMSEHAQSSESDNDDNDEEKLSNIINKETRTAINKLSQLTKKDAQKGHSILKQTKFFENIVDLRIKLQKLMNLINQLPLTSDSYNEDESTKKIVEKNNKLLLKLFNNLFTLRSQFQLDDHISTTIPENKDKKRSYEELIKDTDKLDTDLSNYRSIVLNKWSSKIQMASGSQQLNNNKFKSINQPTNVQVDNQLANMDRLVKRTRLNRGNTKPFNFEKDLKAGNLTLLSNDETIINQENEDEDNIDIPKNYDPRKKDNSTSLDLTENPYIFNDEDFYRLLLNDLLDKKLNDASNKNGINNEITIQSTNSNNKDNKMKKNIDTKASKGRKLNFSIQDPIAHFETPINNGYRWSDEQIDEFFAGLLGQKIDFNESDVESDKDGETEEQKEEDIAIKNDDIQIFG